MTTPNNLLTSALRSIDVGLTGTGPLLEATLLTAGPSHNGTYYPHATLREAAARFTGVKCYLDHAGEASADHRTVRSVADIVGRVEAAWFAEDRIRGRIRLSRTQGALETLLAEGFAGDLSIAAIGTTRLQEREGRLYRVVETISEPLSVDFVTEGAAGGRIERLLLESRIWDQTLELMRETVLLERARTWQLLGISR